MWKWKPNGPRTGSCCTPLVQGNLLQFQMISECNETGLMAFLLTLDRW